MNNGLGFISFSFYFLIFILFFGFTLLYFILNLGKECNVISHVMIIQVTGLSHISQSHNYVTQKKTIKYFRIDIIQYGNNLLFLWKAYVL